MRIAFLPPIRVGLLGPRLLLLLRNALPRFISLLGGTPVGLLATIVRRRFFAHGAPPPN
jgi:hypothetical protein